MDFLGGSGYWLTRFVVQRGLGLLYLVAFLVALNQFRPLLGERGLLPVPLFLKQVDFSGSPSLFFLHYSDRFFALVAFSGVVLSVAALTGLSDAFTTPVSMVVWGLLWLLYLSIVNVGQRFYSFGWESILLETGFLAIFLGASETEPSTITIWLLRWVLFRVMFGAGLIKLRADPCWKDLTCMVYHYETQPMPGPLSWSFHHLPVSLHKGEVLFNHLVELVIPFLYFAPQPFAAIAGLLTIVFQGTLILSGNLSFLNWLTVVLAVSCFSDPFLLPLLPALKPATLAARAFPFEVTLALLALLVAVLSVNPIRNMVSSRQAMNRTFDPLHLVNTYGAFGSVTKQRTEIVVEGTDEAVITETTAWREYEFKGKPGDVSRRPPQIAPYHLRLDWLMWFAAFSSYRQHPWFVHLLAKILQGDRQVVSLLQVNPFPDAPPHYVRALHYRYRFTTAQERRRTGQWWHRELLGTYFPPVSMQDPNFVAALRSQGWRSL